MNDLRGFSIDCLMNFDVSLRLFFLKSVFLTRGIVKSDRLMTF